MQEIVLYSFSCGFPIMETFRKCLNKSQSVRDRRKTITYRNQSQIKFKKEMTKRQKMIEYIKKQLLLKRFIATATAFSGGTGKTTTATNLAYLYASLFADMDETEDAQVLIIDMDSQTASAGHFMEQSESDQSSSGIASLMTMCSVERFFMANHPLEQCVTTRTWTAPNGKTIKVDSMSCDPTTTMIDTRLTQALGEDIGEYIDAKKQQLLGRYKRVVIDGNPAETKLSLGMSDQVIVPFLLTVKNLCNMQSTVQRIGPASQMFQRHASDIFILPLGYNESSEGPNRALQSAKDAFEDYIPAYFHKAENIVRGSAMIENAWAAGEVVAQYKGRSNEKPLQTQFVDSMMNAIGYMEKAQA